MQTKDKKAFVKNFPLYEFNMDKIMEFWYAKDEEKIKEYKYLIMLDLNIQSLSKLAEGDKMVEKYKSDLEKLNRNPRFREYMTKEEDERKCRNTELSLARKEGRKENAKESARELLEMHVNTLEQITKITGLSEEKLHEIMEENNLGSEYIVTSNKEAIDREYMTKEKDERKCRNTELSLARKEGAKQNALETAKNLLSMKILSIKQIAEVTKLSLEEIEKLQQVNN